MYSEGNTTDDLARVFTERLVVGQDQRRASSEAKRASTSAATSALITGDNNCHPGWLLQGCSLWIIRPKDHTLRKGLRPMIHGLHLVVTGRVTAWCMP